MASLHHTVVSDGVEADAAGMSRRTLILSMFCIFGAKRLRKGMPVPLRGWPLAVVGEVGDGGGAGCQDEGCGHGPQSGLMLAVLMTSAQRFWSVAIN